MPDVALRGSIKRVFGAIGSMYNGESVLRN
jgi:hypothetical protein